MQRCVPFPRLRSKDPALIIEVLACPSNFVQTLASALVFLQSKWSERVFRDLANCSSQADVKGTATAMVVPVCFMIAAWTYALCVNFIPSYRDPADKIGAATIGLQNSGGEVASDHEISDDLEKNAEVHKEVVS